MDRCNCVVCNEEFISFSAKRLYCSAQCRQIAFKKRHPEKEKSFITCVVCGDDFEKPKHKTDTCNKCKSHRKQQKKRTHSIAVNMPPTKAHQMNMGHLTKVPANAKTIEEAIAMSPSTSTSMRIIKGKTIIYPRTEKRFNQLNQ